MKQFSTPPDTSTIQARATNPPRRRPGLKSAERVMRAGCLISREQFSQCVFPTPQRRDARLPAIGQTNVHVRLLLLFLNIVLSRINLACVSGNFSFSLPGKILLCEPVILGNELPCSGNASNFHPLPNYAQDYSLPS